MAIGSDFHIQFTSNAAQQIALINQVAAAAQQAQARINASNARLAGAANAGILGGLNAAQVGALTPQLGGLIGQLGRLQSQMGALRALGQQPTLGQLRREMTLLQQIAITGGPAFAQYGAQAQAASASLTAMRGNLDATGASFQRHAGRISETILLYAAFAAASAAAIQSVGLATTIDRESRRLEAVLDLTPSQGREFIQGVGQVAISTVTPFEDLLAQEDLIASAFARTEDPIKKQAQALELTNDVGRITTVTQRDVATETQNLISIMNQANVPVENLGDLLGKVTVAGNDSSTAIAAILDALQIATPGAITAGVSIEELIALVGVFRQTTQRDGSSIGSTFKTLFQTITQPEAQKNLKEITDGLVDVRDAEGNLRPVLEILIQLKTLIDEGAISAQKLPDVFKVLAPPLNPGAAADIKLLFDILDLLPEVFREVSSAGDEALQGLVDKINASLGPQFEKLIEEIKVGFNELFGPEILATGQGLIDFIRLLGSAIGALPPDVVVLIGKFVAFFTAMRLGGFVLRSVVSLLGLGGVAGAATAAGAGAAAAAGGVGVLTGSLNLLIGTLRRVLPLLAAFMAFEFASDIGEQQAGLRGQIGELAVGRSREQLLALRRRLTDQLPKGAEGSTATEVDLGADLLKPFTTDPAVREGIAEIDRLLALLDERGGDATITLEDLGAGFEGASDASEAMRDALNDQETSIDALFEKYENLADGISAVTAEQQLNNEAQSLTASLTEEVASALEKLVDRYREGKISAQEYANGQDAVARASELAGQLVAVAGDELAEMPLFAAAAAEGTDALTAAIFDMIVQSSDQLPVIDQLITRIFGIGTAAAGAAAVAAANPIIIRTFILEPQRGGTLAGGGIPEGAGDPGLGKPGGSFTRPVAIPQVDPNAIGGNIARQIAAALAPLLDVLSGGTSGAFGTGPTGSSGVGGGGGTRQSTLLDIGDLPEDQLAKALRIARRLQDAIPGADKAARDEVINIIKDAEFLKTVKGLDDELLRKAIEELIDVERARLEQERKDALLQNLVVNAGPLSALVTQPTAFGVGGSILGPNGLNLDPSNSPFTVNIAFGDLHSLDSKELLELIYRTINRAIRQATRS